MPRRGYSPHMRDFDFSTETSPSWTPDLPQQVAPAGVVANECDFCGRPLRRENALQRIRRSDDGAEIALMCPECELGTD
jgi:hypothetical protein